MTKLTKEQAAIISAYTGIKCCDFSAVHEYIEKILGRPVWTHELANKALWEKIKEASKQDFLAICYKGEEE